MPRHLPIIKALTATMADKVTVNVVTPKAAIKTASRECQRFLVLHRVPSIRDATGVTQNRRFGSLDCQSSLCQCHYRMQPRLCGMSTISGFKCGVI